MGDKVTIKVIAANLEKRHLDYEWVLTSVTEDGDESVKPHMAPHRPKHKKKKKTE
jgi:ribonuclease R